MRGDRESNPYIGSWPYGMGIANSFQLALGRENSVSNPGCTVDVTSRTSGTYTGTITATVTFL